MEQITISGTKTIVEHITGKSVQKTITLEDNAALQLLFIVHEADIILDIISVGKQSNVQVTCLFLSKNGEKITAKVNAQLAADGASANLYLLSFLGDKADIQVDGGVNIGVNTKGASGHLLEENIVLGKKVKIKTLPMLDVRSSDVSASHGAKIDRLDENKLFYMMAKGLDQKQAQKLIVSGYITRACESIDDMKEEQKEELIGQILAYLDMN